MTITTTTNHLAEQATQTADALIGSTQRLASDTEQLARRGIEAMREGGEQLRERALRVSDGTVAYIKDEPLKAVLIAAAAGAALVVLGSLLTRSRD